MAEKGKPFIDGEFIKNCLTIFTEYACPEKKHLVKQTSLFRLFHAGQMIFQIISKKLRKRDRNRVKLSVWLWMRALTSVTQPNLSFPSELLLLALILLKSF